jgi:hypothetical protein
VVLNDAFGSRLAVGQASGAISFFSFKQHCWYILAGQDGSKEPGYTTQSWLSYTVPCKRCRFLRTYKIFSLASLHLTSRTDSIHTRLSHVNRRHAIFSSVGHLVFDAYGYEAGRRRLQWQQRQDSRLCIASCHAEPAYRAHRDLSGFQPCLAFNTHFSTHPYILARQSR